MMHNIDMLQPERQSSYEVAAQFGFAQQDSEVDTATQQYDFLDQPAPLHHTISTNDYMYDANKRASYEYTTMKRDDSAVQQQRVSDSMPVQSYNRQYSIPNRSKSTTDLSAHTDIHPIVPPHHQPHTVDYTGRHTSTPTAKPEPAMFTRQISADKHAIHQQLQMLQRQQEYLIQQLLPENTAAPHQPHVPQQHQYSGKQVEYDLPIVGSDELTHHFDADTTPRGRTSSLDYDNDRSTSTSPEYSIHDLEHTDVLQTHSSTSVDDKGKRVFHCDSCMKPFYHKGTLRRHLRIHTGEKPYVCTHPQCNRAFNQKIALVTHLRTHTGEKPYACNVCDQEFAYKNNLTAHLRKHSELGDKPFVCNVCTKAFGYRGTLERHKKIHDDEIRSANAKKKALKPHACTYDMCSKRFNKRESLSAHMQQHAAADKHTDDQSDIHIHHQLNGHGDSITHELLHEHHDHQHEQPRSFYHPAADQSFNDNAYIEPVQSYDDGQPQPFRTEPVSTASYATSAYNPHELEYLFGFDNNFHSDASIHTIAMH